MADELKPCPFCPDGGEAKYLEGYQRDDGSWVRGAVKCRKCGVVRYGKDNDKPGFLSLKEEADLSLTAIKAWNTRANTRAERTCHAEIDWDAMEDGISGYRIWQCSCGEQFLHFRGLKPSFCPECGAKVVE